MAYSGGGVLSIPELRKAFEHIQSFTAKHLDGAVNDDLVAAFIKEWKRTFGKTIKADQARAYLEHMKELGPDVGTVKGSHKRTLKGSRRGQSGGAAALGGAPLDHTTQPGVYGEYGHFLPYVARGFGVGTPELSHTRPAVPDPSMDIPKDVGSGALLKGGSRGSSSGKRRQTRRISGRKIKGGNFILSTIPTSVIQDATIHWRGQPAEASPAAEDTGRHIKI
jgi:hypothetical protein